jgi:coenzyme Q-binding protein COQ10
MNSYETTERLPYSAQQMFDLVASVDDYHLFMPLCERSEVFSRRELDDGRVELKAMLEVKHAKTGLGGVFESLVHLDRAGMTISASSQTGPVRHLANSWAFKDLGEGACDAVFFIEYEMRNWPLQVVMNRVYKRVFDKLAGSFRQRALDLYGPARSMPVKAS